MWQRGKVSIKNVFLGLRFFFSNESETKKIFSSRSSKMLLLLLRRDGGILEMKLMTSRDLTQKYFYRWPVFDWFLDRGTIMVMMKVQWWCQELHCNWNSNWLLKFFLLVKSVHIMLVSPQAAQLSIHFLLKKISSAAPPCGTWIRTYYWVIERAGFEPMTSRVLLCRPVLYRCATPAALKDCWNTSYEGIHQTDGTSTKYFKRYLHLSFWSSPCRTVSLLPKCPIPLLFVGMQCSCKCYHWSRVSP